MSHESASHETTFGYLSTIESPEHGYFGGYLVVSVLGRPLEFHCTAPVRVNRAQEILYGPTLEPYLLGEQIGGALLGVAKLTPRVILTNREAVMHARPRTNVPMVLLLRAIEQADATHASTFSTSGFGSSLADFGRFTLGDYDFQLPLGHESEHDVVAEALTLLAQHVDLAEPFDRIHEAIREAQRIGGRGAESHEQAA